MYIWKWLNVLEKLLNSFECLKINNLSVFDAELLYCITYWTAPSEFINVSTFGSENVQ